MVLEAEVELILSCLSEAGILMIISLYLFFPIKFFKHPSQLYFYILIVQLIMFALDIAVLVMILR